ncbi:signal peptidase I [Caldisalinibacter kiritimatiensis]|uniref:Signal peptidase I n=1 Tax=Caldisalinibacter kiritimatiensis TaxID=1304284 RepID=R1AWX4_9FIRM|nr:signal peptidase I [Caldisalinibacter kiritimatiensis]EOD01703.1 peptidase S26B, signal peptidase [Caldisalinibacter kiritimatiensis]
MTKKIAKWIGNIILVLLVIVVISTFYSNIKHKNNPNYIPSILGYKPMSVLTGSMRPVLEPGDMIVAKEIDPTKIKVGDVITYKVSESTLVTHRVIEIIKKDNKIMFKTQGDANNVEDSKLVSTDQVVGVLAFNIPKGGYIANFIRSPKGFIFLILLPLFFLIIGEVKTMLSQIEEESNKESSDLWDNVDQ